MNLVKRIDICEVGPRDGLQNEQIILDVEQKVELINMATDAGYKRIEIGSLMHPKAVPSMADTEEVYKTLDKKEGVEYQVLVTNLRGVQRAVDAKMKKVKLSVSASDKHNLNNFNRTTEESVRGFQECIDLCNQNNIQVAGGIATAFGCPFEGEIGIDRVEMIVKEYIKMGLDEISMADTTGMANPKQVYEMCLYFVDKYPDVKWSLHLHNTRDMGMANVFAAMQAGVSMFDASFSGLGGCPYAPGATGNICSEDVINMCNDMGIETGVDIDKAIELSKKAKEFVKRETESYVLRAGKTSDLYKLEGGE